MAPTLDKPNPLLAHLDPLRRISRLRLKQVLSLARRDPALWYRPHARQAEFHAVGKKAVERLFLAGNRVGKSLAGAVEVVFHLTGRYPAWWQGHRFDHPVQAWVASVSREVTRDILQPLYLGGTASGLLLPELVLGRWLKASGPNAVDTVHIRHASGGVSELAFKSFDQGRASFQGTAKHVVHLDEEPPLEVFEECLLRTVTVGGRMLVTMTPLLGETPLVAAFLDRNRPGRSVIKAGWCDAPHLPEAELARLRANLRPDELSAREHGVPLRGAGRVFPVAREALAVARFEVPTGWRRCVGLDFGWSNPTAAVWLAEDPASGVVFVTDTYSACEKTPAEHAAAVLARGAWIPGVCDPAGQAAGAKDGESLRAAYGRAGMWLQPAENAVEAGLMLLLERMRAGTLKVFDDLHDWWREFGGYHRDREGRVVKRDDHLLDATRYALVSGLPLARAGPQLAHVRAPARSGDWRVV